LILEKKPNETLAFQRFVCVKALVHGDSSIPLPFSSRNEKMVLVEKARTIATHSSRRDEDVG